MIMAQTGKQMKKAKEDLVLDEVNADEGRGLRMKIMTMLMMRK